MRIAYIVPGLMDAREVTRRGELLKEWAFPNTEVDIVSVTEGPTSIESMYEKYLSIPATAKEVIRLEKEGYNAAILGCAGDPGLDAMREITSKMLVVGPAETSLLTASMLGHKFSIINVDESLIPSAEEIAYKAGVLDKLASVRSLNIAVLDLAINLETTLKRIIQVSKKAIEEDGADSLVLGCMTMGFLNIAEEISDILKVPVINPSKISLKMAESLIGSGLMHSKKAFAFPPKLSSRKVKNISQLFLKNNLSKY